MGEHIQAAWRHVGSQTNLKGMPFLLLVLLACLASAVRPGFETDEQSLDAEHASEDSSDEVGGDDDDEYKELANLWINPKDTTTQPGTTADPDYSLANAPDDPDLHPDADQNYHYPGPDTEDETEDGPSSDDSGAKKRSKRGKLSESQYRRVMATPKPKTGMDKIMHDLAIIRHNFEERNQSDTLLGKTYVKKNNWLVFFAQGETDSSSTHLTSKGVKSVKKRMDLLHSKYTETTYDWLDYIAGPPTRRYNLRAGVNEIWVAPDAGAMATVLIMLTKAWVDRELTQGVMSMDRPMFDTMSKPIGGGRSVEVEAMIPFPTVRLVPEMRAPRLPQPRLPEGLEDYLKRIADSLVKEYIPTDLRGVFSIALSYVVESMTQQFRGQFGSLKWWKETLTDAAEVYDHIHTIKHMLAWKNQEVLLVGHRDLAAYMFQGLWLSSAYQLKDELADETLMGMSRKNLMTIAECGFMKVHWQELSPARPPIKPNPDDPFVSVPLFDKLDMYVPQPVAKEMPNIAQSPFTRVPFDQPGYVYQEGTKHLPKTAYWYGPFGLKKRKKKLNSVVGIKKEVWSPFSDRLFYLSYVTQPREGTDPVAWFIWLTALGDRVKGVRNVDTMDMEKLTASDGTEGIGVFVLEGKKVVEEWELLMPDDAGGERLNEKRDIIGLYKAWESVTKVLNGTRYINEMTAALDANIARIEQKYKDSPSAAKAASTATSEMDKLLEGLNIDPSESYTPKITRMETVVQDDGDEVDYSKPGEEDESEPDTAPHDYVNTKVPEDEKVNSEDYDTPMDATTKKPTPQESPDGLHNFNADEPGAMDYHLNQEYTDRWRASQKQPTPVSE
mmetsp:Transcript_63725/g.151903  ORF Transcript_63725/g.151903 Transcript_63725/m.151903 type:complete len:838 (+) Transcript_63725:114-2627(+)